METLPDLLVRAINEQTAGRLAEAERLFRESLLRLPANPVALYSLAVISLTTGRADDAERFTREGVSANPAFAPLHFARATVLQRLGKFDEALAHYDRAVEIKPDYTEALLNSGALLRERHRHREALERFNRILTYNPDYPAALANCAILLTEFKESRLAIAMFSRLMAVQPDHDYALGLLAYERLHICDWTDFAATKARIEAGVLAGRRVCKTLALMAFSDDPEVHLVAARTFAAGFCPRAPTSHWRGERYRHRRIRLAYVSPDLREHPVGHLMAGVFERHDRARFEITAISIGIDDGSRLRQRIAGSCDRFIDAKGLTSENISATMRELEIDIAVDLAGYTSDARPQIFAHRPAPVQVSYLGYNGTSGTDYIDYLIGDSFVVPEALQSGFDERVVYLPDCYLPCADGIALAAAGPSRADCGLPDSGFVFCSFNHDYKLNPEIFDVWMRLLRAIDGSVLWLMGKNPLARENLRKEATARGISADRLVFADRLPRVEDHLARYRNADLFLDTHPYNAHTTAADALMMGLPVLTYSGRALPSRVAGSLVRTAGIPELAVDSILAYEATALRLARDPVALRETKSRLLAGSAGGVLRDTAAYTRSLEDAYVAMYRRAQLGGCRDGLSPR